MNKLFIALSMLIILSYPVSITAQDDFATFEAFSKSVTKGEDRVSDSAKGDLNGDGLEDWAAVVYRKPEDASPTYQLFVLLREGQGGYRVAVKSIEEEIPGMGCCWLESLEVRNASVYVQNNAKTASDMEAVTHQFKLLEGEWRLVGIKSSYTDHTPKAESTVDTEMNLLTGLVIEKTKKGKRKPVTTRSQKKFATFLLKDFDFSHGFGIE
jgi:hypothetical protein